MLLGILDESNEVCFDNENAAGPLVRSEDLVSFSANHFCVLITFALALISAKSYDLKNDLDVFITK